MEFALDEYGNDSEIMYVSGYTPMTHHSLYLTPYISEALGIWKHKFDLQLQFGNDSKPTGSLQGIWLIIIYWLQ